MSMPAALEAVLFVAGKPLSLKKLAKTLGVSEAEIISAIATLSARYGEGEGVRLFQNGDEYQLVTNPAYQAAAEQFVKAEIEGELTRPQLEALTVVAYRGPITRPELEAIRGVNCSLILRNLMLRGLVEERTEATALLPQYQVTMDYLRHIGKSSVAELPDYATLHAHEFMNQAVQEATATG